MSRSPLDPDSPRHVGTIVGSVDGRPCRATILSGRLWARLFAWPRLALRIATTLRRVLTAEVLLAHVLGVDKAFLYAHPDERLDGGCRQRLQELVERRCAGVPTQYLTGVQEFFGLEFEVTPDVLIPRPETEHLVEAALEVARPGDRIVDVGTGSGCVAIALKSKLPDVYVGACDVSPAALEVAGRTQSGSAQRSSSSPAISRRHCVPRAWTCWSRIRLMCRWPTCRELQRELRAEPSTALFGGEDGLEAYRRLAPQAAVVLRPGGRLLLELGYHIRPAVEAMLPDAEWEPAEVKRDLAGLDRVLTARKTLAPPLAVVPAYPSGSRRP